MFRFPLCIALIAAAGCSEYDLRSSLPPQGADLDRPLEQVYQSDELVQVTTPAVDVLWVIDNSCSMGDEQAALATNFPVFMDFFVGIGLDYHVGVISTDTEDQSHNGRLRDAGGQRWLDPETINPSDKFSYMANMGVGGFSVETGIGAAYEAIEVHRDGYNAGFVRDDAAMHIIVVSDEEDQTRGDPITTDEFIDYLNALKFVPDDVTFSSIVNPPGCCGGIFSEASAGLEYIAVTQAVGGILWPIDDTDWTLVLERLGARASGLKQEFFLSQLPAPGTIDVSVVDDGTRYTFDEGGDWTYDPVRNSITFIEYVPNGLARVVIDYQLLGSAEL